MKVDERKWMGTWRKVEGGNEPMISRAWFSEDVVIEMRLERIVEQNCYVKIVCYGFLVDSELR